MKKFKFFRPVVSREVYTRRAIESAWPSGHWVEDTRPVDGMLEFISTNVPLRPEITFIGGTKFDELALETRLRDLAPDTLVITGTGRGAEKLVRDLAPELGLELLELAPDQSHGPRTGAVNVEQILCAALDSPLVLVGGGERVKHARSWLARANWGREVSVSP